MGWNLFDFSLVMLSIIEIVMTEWELVEGDSSTTASAGQVLRLFRASRIIRILQVLRCVVPLRLVIESIVHSFTLLCWVFVLFFSQLHVFGVILTLVVAGYEEKTHDSFTSASLSKHFGSLVDSMFSLWMAACGVTTWEELFNSLLYVSKILSIVFLVSVFFPTR